MRGLSLVIVGVAAVLLGACAAPPPPTFGRPDIDSINKQLQEFIAAYNVKDAAKVATMFTSGAMVLPPNASTVQGSASIQEYYVNRFKQGASKLSLEPNNVSGSGTLAYANGNYRLTMAPEGGPEHPDRGKFLFVFRNSNGVWLLEDLMFSSDFAPTAPPH
jgi:ketosteroid isomerase-like protein